MENYRSNFTKSYGSTRAPQPPCDFGRDFLRAADGVPMALFAQELSEVEKRLRLFLALAAEWCLGSRLGGAASGWARSTGARGEAHRGQCGFTERENHRKRGPRGFDENKRLRGRKRFARCEARGNWLESVVLPANTGERQGALGLFKKVKAATWSQNLKLIWADDSSGPMKDLRESLLKPKGKRNLAGSWTTATKCRARKVFVRNASAG